MIAGRKIAAIALMSSLLAACGGGGGGSQSTIPSAPKTPSTTKVRFTIAFPAKSAQKKKSAVTTVAAAVPSHRKARPAHHTFVRHPLFGTLAHASASTSGRPPVSRKTGPSTPVGYNSYSTKSIGWSVGSTGSLPALNAPQITANVSATHSDANTVCSAGGSNGAAFTCTFNISAPVGYDDFQFTEWDGLGATGHLLAVASFADTLTSQNQVNSIDVEPSGVVNGATPTLTTATMVSGGANQTTTLGIDAVDYDGNLITGTTNFVDNTGAQTTITVDSTYGGAAGDFGYPSAFSFQTPADTDTLNYQPAAGSGQVTNVVFTTTASSSNVPSANLFNTTLQFTSSGAGLGIPGAPQVAAAFTTNATPTDIVSMGGNLFVNESNQIEEFDSAGVSQGLTLLGADNAKQLIAGADTHLWYVSGSGDVCSVAPGGISPSCAGLTSANYIATGSDGLVYYSDSSGLCGSVCAIGQIQPRGSGPVVANMFNLNTGSNAASGVQDVENLSAGPDNSAGDHTIWFTDQVQGLVYVLDTATGIVTSTGYSGDVADCGGEDQPTQMVLGRDGLMYVLGSCYGDVASIDPTTGNQINDYVMEEYNVDSQSGMALGPDGRIWVTDGTSSPTNFDGSVAGFDVIAPSISTSYTQFYGYDTVDSVFNMPALGSSNWIASLTLGPDGNLWYTDAGTNQIGVLHL